MSDAINHPRHYTSHPAGIECIDVIEHFPCNVANAVKYLWRCGLKGDRIEDLRKALWYMEREIVRRMKFPARGGAPVRRRKARRTR